MQIPEELRYTENHEWARLEDDGTIRIGITDYAQDSLGDIVFVDLPDVGAAITAGEPFAEVESTKSVSDVYGPVSGAVGKVNGLLADSPEIVNQDPYGDGWFVVIAPEEGTGIDNLMDAAAYRAFVE
ncbi:MAG: glycine cleavage system protein GcvH [Acidimicrobiia bacterium]